MLKINLSKIKNKMIIVNAFLVLSINQHLSKLDSFVSESIRLKKELFTVLFLKKSIMNWISFTSKYFMNFFSSSSRFLPLNFFSSYSINKFSINIFYLNFFFFILLAVSGSFFQVNSNFLLFFTFTFFLLSFTFFLVVCFFLKM